MIIGLCGLMGSGKGTAADVLVEDLDFVKMSFADSLKDGVAAMFDFPRNLLEGDTFESREWREIPDEFWSEEMGVEMTPRKILQLVGTDCLRENFYGGIWVSILKKKIIDASEQGINVVIPDTRFVNEIDMIKSIGGDVWHIWRDVPRWAVDYRKTEIAPENIHPSEYSWILSDADISIINDSTLEKLKSEVFKHVNERIFSS